jgi:hypothetical protein
MFNRFRRRRKQPASYSFYVWEDGKYVHIEGGQHESDQDAASAAAELTSGSAAIQRPASLDAPHLHVVREDGVHILTLELPEDSRSPLAA